MNTQYCYDNNGREEFKCECNEGFDGKDCGDKCPLDCKDNEICITDIIGVTKKWICVKKCQALDKFPRSQIS